jgi:hypothetical protein
MLHAPGVACWGPTSPCGCVRPRAGASSVAPVTGSETCLETTRLANWPWRRPTANSVPCCCLKRCSVNVPLNWVPSVAAPWTGTGSAWATGVPRMAQVLATAVANMRRATGAVVEAGRRCAHCAGAQQRGTVGQHHRPFSLRRFARGVPCTTSSGFRGYMGAPSHVRSCCGRVRGGRPRAGWPSPAPSILSSGRVPAAFRRSGRSTRIGSGHHGECAERAGRRRHLTGGRPDDMGRGGGVQEVVVPDRWRWGRSCSCRRRAGERVDGAAHLQCPDVRECARFCRGDVHDSVGVLDRWVRQQLPVASPTRRRLPCRTLTVRNA